MVRRSLGALLWSLVGLLACSLGALSALVGSGAGRSLLAAVTRKSLERAVAGSVELGDVSGPLLTGVTLSQVKLYDPDSTLVAWLPRGCPAPRSPTTRSTSPLAVSCCGKWCWTGPT